MELSTLPPGSLQGVLSALLPVSPLPHTHTHRRRHGGMATKASPPPTSRTRHNDGVPLCVWGDARSSRRRPREEGGQIFIEI